MKLSELVFTSAGLVQCESKFCKRPASRSIFEATFESLCAGHADDPEELEEIEFAGLNEEQLEAGDTMNLEVAKEILIEQGEFEPEDDEDDEDEDYFADPDDEDDEDDDDED
jgi:hypothetical protein